MYSTSSIWPKVRTPGPRLQPLRSRVHGAQLPPRPPTKSPQTRRRSNPPEPAQSSFRLLYTLSLSDYALSMVFISYSSDLKVAVLRLMLQGKQQHEINGSLGVDISADSFARWKRLYDSTRAVISDPRTYEAKGPPAILDTDQRELLLAVLQNDPDLYLDEIQRRLLEEHEIVISRQTICRELHEHLNMSYKVARTVHPNQDATARAAYIRRISAFPVEQLVFADESSICCDALERRMAWAPKGLRTARLPRTRAGHRFSLLPAVDVNGHVAHLVQEGPICRLDFEYFVEWRLLPAMNAWPARRSVLVIDNVAVHKGGRIQDLCDLRGVLLIYLPTYSPDLNPIEKGFSVLKAALKRSRELNGTDDDIETLRRVIREVFTRRLMHTLFRISGYENLVL